ncbi:MAG: hypothetical protein QW767_05295, partial [Thermoprotei archaeon]
MKLDNAAMRAGVAVQPKEMMKKMKLLLKIAIPVSSVLAYTIFRATHIPYALVLPAAALTVILMYYPVKLSARASERRKKIERELPFASTILALAATHSSPINTMGTLSGSRSLTQTSEEYRNLIKRAKLSHVTPAQAAATVAETNPSPRFQSFLRTLSAAERGVGDTLSSLRDLAQSELQALASEVELSTEKLGVASSTVLVAFAVAPLTALIFAAITGTTALVYAILALSVPAAFGVSMLISQSFPSVLKPALPHMSAKSVILFASGIAAGVILYVRANLPPPMGLAVAMIAGTVPLAIYYRSASRRHLQLIKNLPALTRDLAEEAKKGQPPSVALRRLRSSGKYPAAVLSHITSVKASEPYI